MFLATVLLLLWRRWWRAFFDLDLVSDAGPAADRAVLANNGDLGLTTEVTF